MTFIDGLPMLRHSLCGARIQRGRITSQYLLRAQSHGQCFFLSRRSLSFIPEPPLAPFSIASNSFVVSVVSVCFTSFFSSGTIRRILPSGTIRRIRMLHFFLLF